MRGLITLFFTVMAVVVLVGVVGIPMIEGIGESVKTYGTIDTIDGESTIDNIYQALFVRVPLILVFGMFAWGCMWYIRRQQTTV